MSKYFLSGSFLLVFIYFGYKFFNPSLVHIKPDSMPSKTKVHEKVENLPSKYIYSHLFGKKINTNQMFSEIDNDKDFLSLYDTLNTEDQDSIDLFGLSDSGINIYDILSENKNLNLNLNHKPRIYFVAEIKHFLDAENIAELELKNTYSNNELVLSRKKINNKFIFSLGFKFDSFLQAKNFCKKAINNKQDCIVTQFQLKEIKSLKGF